MKTIGLQIKASGGILLMAILLGISSGCATPQPPPSTGRIVVPSPSSGVPAGRELVEAEASTGQLIKFGQLRTVIRSQEEVIAEDGSSRMVEEIRPELDRELASRDFRMFTATVPPGTDIAKLSRETQAQLVLDVTARSKFVNSTGKFSKYRAEGEIRAIRGRDGTLLAVARAEQMGPRHQDDERAGELALREITPSLSEEVMSKLIDKQNQLLWAGLIVNRVKSASQAQTILRELETSGFIDYVELLSWDSATREATYELIYGLRHDSDLIEELSRVQGIAIQSAAYEPGQMTVLQKIMRRYK